MAEMSRTALRVSPRAEHLSHAWLVPDSDLTSEELTYAPDIRFLLGEVKRLQQLAGHYETALLQIAEKGRDYKGSSRREKAMTAILRAGRETR